AATAAEFGVSATRMVATSATRDAGNREVFFDMVRSHLGVDAEVISGAEEARLSLVGAVSEQRPGAGPFLVVDVGGGSTELGLGDWDGRTASVRASHSADIGSVRITERALRADPPSHAEIEAACRYTVEMLGPAFEAVDVSMARTWIGLAGTVTTLSALVQELPEYDPARTHLSRLSATEIKTVTERLLSSDHTERAANAVIHPGRVDVIGGGALVVRTLAEQLAERGGPDSLVVSEHDVLDGIALSLA